MHIYYNKKYLGTQKSDKLTLNVADGNTSFTPEHTHSFGRACTVFKVCEYTNRKPHKLPAKLPKQLQLTIRKSGLFATLYASLCSVNWQPQPAE